jgi:hypothetical protein
MVGLSDEAVVPYGAGMMPHMFAIVPLPAEKAGWWACALFAWVSFRVTAVEGVVGRVVGASTVVADHGGGGSGAVSYYVAEPMALVALRQGWAGVKLTGPAIGPEECRGRAADQFETSAIWVIEGPDDAAAVAAVSDISSRAAKPSWQS